MLGGSVTDAETFIRDFLPQNSPFDKAEIVTVAELTARERESIPQAWFDIVSQGGEAAVHAAIGMWEMALPDRFPVARAMLDKHGLTVKLARVVRFPYWRWGFTPPPANPSNEPPPAEISLLYVLDTPWRTSQPEPLLWFGFAPHTAENLPEYWPEISDSIGAIFTALHNGIVDEDYYRIRSIDEFARLSDLVDAPEDVEQLAGDGAALGGSAVDFDDVIGVCRNPNGNWIGIEAHAGNEMGWRYVQSDDLLMASRIDIWEDLDDALAGWMTR